MESWSRDLDLRRLVELHHSPLYLHHRPTLRRNFDAYAALVGDPSRVRYPVKANPSPVVLRPLARWGCGADCASESEIRHALEAGISVQKISYTTPAMDLALAEWLLEQGGTVVVDSADDLAELSRKLSERPAERQGEPPDTGRIFLRVSPGDLPGYRESRDFQRFTAHGAASSQFGIPSERVVEILAGSSLPISGFHVHVGTMMDQVETFVVGLQFLHALVDAVEAETSHAIDTLNLGGGLGLPHFPDQEFPRIEELAAALRREMRDDLTYHVEPGNSLVGDSFALVTTLVSRKESRGRVWGICDVGTDQLVKHTVARWEHQITDADGRPLPTEGDDALAGPLCFAGDVLLPATDLSGLRRGDPLLVRHAGAYCEAIASRFNGRLSPPTLVLGERGTDEADSHLERRREDPFYEPTLQSHRPGALVSADDGEPFDPATLASLQSEYMHELAENEGYEIVDARHLGDGAYAFEIEARAPVGFVALPLALRMVGDTSIISVGRELGWQRKERPVWASRLTLTAARLLPSDGRLPCRVVVSHLPPGRKSGVIHRGHVHFELGPEAEIRGTAQVSLVES